MEKKEYMAPAVSVVLIQHKMDSLVASGGDKVYDEPESGSLQLSRRGNTWSFWDDEDDAAED